MSKNIEMITASVEIHAWLDRAAVVEWFENRISDEEPEDARSYGQRIDDFLSVVGDDGNLNLYLNNGGAFSDYNVDEDEYFEHCFEEFQ